MGGLGVGPTGQAQMPHAEAQYSVSGQRGRRAPSINPMHSQQQPEHFQHSPQPAQQQHQAGNRCNMLLIYNGQDGQSLQLLQQLIQQNSQPHPQVFKSLVRAVDSRQPDQEAALVISKLSSHPQFRPMLQSGCILFDFLQKRAYHDYGAICQMISLQKNATVSAILEQQFMQQQQQMQQMQQQQQQPPLQPNQHIGNMQTPTQLPYGSRQIVGGIGSHDQKSVRSFARRSVLGGVNPEELERIAEEANKHVRRGNVSAYGRQNQMAGDGQQSAGSSTLFESLGNHEAVAGGQEGSLAQINTKAYRRQ